jgi:outer membrane protein OmpA-like peptidoglycan-associated protein
LIQEAWGGTVVSRHTVNVTVAEVRRSLDDCGSWILWRPKLGFCLSARVRLAIGDVDGGFADLEGRPRLLTSESIRLGCACHTCAIPTRWRPACYIVGWRIRMLKLTATAIATLLALPALAQTPGNPTQQSVVSQSQGQTPLFRVTVVGRTTAAINYRPRSGDTKVDFSGTPLLPDARGSATVSGEKGYIRIDARFDKLQPPSRFGGEYLTYVLWAITPEGRATNLGEVQVDDEDARIKVTTELQSFGMIVTAEPYFAVTQPSDVVVMENVVRDNTKGRVETIQAKYELLKRGSYLMNQDASRLKIKPLEPGAPLDLGEARNAVELARLAGADRYATETFGKASRLLADAETAREKKKHGNEVMQPARQAAQTAEDARLIALQKQEEEYVAQQRAAAAERERQAQAQALDAQQRALADQQRAQDEAERRRQAELATQNEAERRRQAEVDSQAAAQARAAADQARLEAERQRAEAQQARADADAARVAADAERQKAEQARAAAEAQAQQAQATAAQAQQEQDHLRQQLRDQLNVILETRETARGLIVNLSDVLFDTASATLKTGAREKLARVSGILLSHPDLHVEVEGHTDNVGSDDYNQRLSERRAQSVRAYLVQNNIKPEAVGTAGFGESRPVATNGTAAGRQQNRRVELVVTGESIGRQTPQ